MITSENDYLCVGICITDPDSGYCLGCGRPPPPVSIDSRKTAGAEMYEQAAASSLPSASRYPDSPENH